VYGTKVPGHIHLDPISVVYLWPITFNIRVIKFEEDDRRGVEGESRCIQGFDGEISGKETT
jgi:hypothetical protein